MLSCCGVPGPKSGSVEGGALILEPYAKAVEVGIMLTGPQITFAKVDTKWAKPHTTFRERHTTSAEVDTMLAEPHTTFRERHITSAEVDTELAEPDAKKTEKPAKPKKEEGWIDPFAG